MGGGAQGAVLSRKRRCEDFAAVQEIPQERLVENGPGPVADVLELGRVDLDGLLFGFALLVAEV